MTTSVLNLKTGEVRVYVGPSPQEAVVCAHAQEHDDWNTWDYRNKYRSLVREGQKTVSCGDWCAIKTQGRE